MYLPYISKRHDLTASIGEYDAVRHLFERGGLILIKRDEQAICAMISIVEGQTCMAFQMGVHKDHFDQVAEGCNVALWWFMMDWARSQNLSYFDFGESRPMTGNGVFNFKRQWGAKVVIDVDPETRWVFASNKLVAPLREYLNECGFISEIDRHLYQVILSDNSDAQVNHTQLQAHAAEFGLDGVVLIAPLKSSVIIKST